MSPNDSYRKHLILIINLKDEVIFLYYFIQKSKMNVYQNFIHGNNFPILFMDNIKNSFSPKRIIIFIFMNNFRSLNLLMKSNG